MPPISMMIKPASGMCNLRCAYCFYADEARLRTTPDYGFMSEETAETLLKKFLATATGQCSIAFQGGEPTLRGLDFFRRFVALEQQLNTNRVPVQYALQTNGMHIDDEWASFLAEHAFLVGVSMDGNKDCHNRFRRDAAGKGSFARVTKTVALLEHHNVAYNILLVVTNYLARHINSVFASLKKAGIGYQQYIPCMDPLQAERGGQPYSLTPDQYGDFLITLFGLWMRELEQGRYYSIRFFDNLVSMLRGQEPELCAMAGRCTVQYLIEADGSVFPCDFYAMDAYRLGTVATDSIDALDTAREAMGFIRDSLALPGQCRACEWVHLCRNGCRRDRRILDGAPDLNYYCAAYRRFFRETAAQWARIEPLLRCAAPV